MAPEGTDDASYAALLAAGQRHYPGVRIGRPGRSRSYWATIAALRALRARWRIDIEGAEHVPPGAAVLIGNHVSALDPVVVVMSAWWRVTAFTKLEWFQSPLAPFFRFMGQIPLRRGDPDATDWAIEMASSALAYGGKVGLYPEGTRSPDPRLLHRLHGRVLLPVLRANPDVPVFAVTTRYTAPSGGRLPRRIHVSVRISPPLALDAHAMEPDAVLTVVREALLRLGGQTYVDVSARDAKRNREGTETG